MFQSLDQILGGLQVRLLTSEQQQFQSILDLWPAAIGPRAIAHTRPISLSRGVLRVAASSAAWSQQLTFGRSQILRRLNQSFSNPLHDIKFSAALWQSLPDLAISEGDDRGEGSRRHPSFVENVPPSPTPVLPAITPGAAFQNWAEIVQRRSQSLPECPQCHCPTPPGELERWSVCAMCFGSQRLHSSSRIR